MKLVLAVIVIGLLAISGPAEQRPEPEGTSVYSTTLTVWTYPYAAYLQTRYSDEYSMTYQWLNWAAYNPPSRQPHLKDYVALVMENNWLRLTILPELGGRLYGITVKATGQELLYQNPVIKPSPWGPPEQGWWLAAGGIEWCLPVEEHGYEWGIPWGYEISETADGATVTVFDSESTDRVRARIAIHLPSDEAAVRISPRLENPTGSPVSFKFWSNSMQAPGWSNSVGPDLRFVFPIDQVTVHSRGDAWLPGPGEPMDWPSHGGIYYARLGSWNQWLGFFARPQAEVDWAGIYDEAAHSGLARVFPHQTAVGLKGFGFGWSSPIDWHNWTDDGSTYVELHSGPAPTFWDTITLQAGGVLEWTETWLPVRDLPELSLVTATVALGVKALGQDLQLGFLLSRQATGLGARLWNWEDCTLLWSQDGLALSAGEAYTDIVAGVGLSAEQVALAVLQDGELLVTTGVPDCPPLSSEVSPLPSFHTSGDFWVNWSGVDPGQGVASYDLQVRDGVASADWTPWLTGTTSHTALFSGQDGHTYAFRSRARDIFGGQEAWPTGDWDDTFSTVLLEPAPVLVTSEKRAEPMRAELGDVVQFEVFLANTGNLGASVQVTDRIPTSLVLVSVPVSTLPPDPVVISDTIVWNGNVATGQSGVISFEAQVVDLPGGGLISNAAWIDDGIHAPLVRAVTVDARLRVYLPLVLGR